MARFVIVAVIALSPITYLFDDPERALAKARTLQRNVTHFTIADHHGQQLTIADLERACEARRSG